MPDILKDKALKLLKRAVEDIGAMGRESAESPKFKQWMQTTKSTVARLFGEESRQAKNFNSVSYYYPSVHPVAQEEIDEAFCSGLEDAQARLAAMIHEVTEFWPDQPSAMDDRKEASARPSSPSTVFVVHGRNLEARDAMFIFLRSVGLHPLEWAEAIKMTGKTQPYIQEILDTAFGSAGAVVVLLTPDDEARLRLPWRNDNDPPHESELTPQARANVLFEAGMALGRDPARTVLVELGSLRPFSDLAGMHVIRMDDTSQRRQELAHRLEAAGCPVNLDGTDWHSAGDFSMESPMLKIP